MNRSATVLFVALSAAAASFALTACGGDDEVAAAAAAASGAEPPPAAGAPGVPTATACFPDLATLDAVTIGTPRPVAERRMGCAGQVADPALATAADLGLRWQDPTDPRRTALLRFDASGLVYKTATRVDTASPPSTCVPTQDAFDRLPQQATAREVAQAFGCAGQHVGLVQSIGYREDRYAWGAETEAPPRATVHIANGLVVDKQGTGLQR